MAETLIQYAAMVPNLLHRGIVEVFVEENPILQQLHFINVGESMAWEFNREASLGGVGTRQLEQDFGAAAKVDGQNASLKEGTAVVGGDVETDIQKLATRDQKIAKRMKAASRYFSWLFFHGNMTVDPTQFDGLLARVGDANLVYAGANGGYLNLETLSKLIARVPGGPADKVLYMGSDMRLNLGAAIRAQENTRVAYVEWQGQMTPASYDGVKIVDPGDDAQENPVLGFNERRGNSQITGSIVCTRLGRNIDGEYLQGVAKLTANGVFDTRFQGEWKSKDNVHIEGRMGVANHHKRGIVAYRGIVEGVAPAA